jgi:hypothetical protein
MKISGAQNPGPPFAVHVASCPWLAGGTRASGTQWAPLHAGSQAPNEFGSMIGGPS